MKTLYLTLTAVILFTVISCKQSFHYKALKLCNEMRSTNDSIYIKVKNIGWEFSRGFLTGNYSFIHPQRIEMERYLKNKLEDFKRLEITANLNLLRNREMSYLEFELNACQHYFTKYENMDASTSEHEINEALSNLVYAREKEQVFFDEINDLLEKVARENDLPFTRPVFRDMYK